MVEGLTVVEKQFCTGARQQARQGNDFATCGFPAPVAVNVGA
jgi:hypothetical protein